MTALLQLVKTGDALADSTTISLLAFTDGFDLADNGWVQAVAGEGDTSVVETLTVVVRGTSHDDLAAKLRALDTQLQVIPRSRDNTQLYELWLRVHMVNETQERQALLLSARRAPMPIWRGEVSNSVGGYFYQEAYTLALERRPWWESDDTPDGGVAGQMAGVSSVGGLATIPFTVGGSVPARLASADLTGDVVAANTLAAALNKVWLGIRTSEYGVVANFQPYWSLRKATLFGVGADTMDTTGGTTNADATAKDGYKTITTFNTTPGLARRATIKVTAVTANPADQRGTFLVLLRAKVGATIGPVRVRLSDGLYGSTAFNTRARVVVNTGFYQFYELGTVQIPTPSHTFSFTNLLMSNYSLAIDAERVPNTAGVSLHMDCLVLIPINEFLFTSDLSGVDLAQSTDHIQAGELANGGLAGMAVVGSNPNASGTFRVSGGVPITAGAVVLAAQRGGVSILTDTNTILLNTIRRFDTLRGSA